MTIVVSAYQERSPFAEGRRQSPIHGPPSLEPEGQSKITGHWESRRTGQVWSTKADRINGPAVGAILFGPFRLLPSQRLLLHEGEPVRLGSRALDTLIALLDRPGTLVTKDELISRVWPDTHVDEGSLKVHVAALRRVLGDCKGGARYIATDVGRGYRFVAPVRFAGDLHPSTPAAATTKCKHNLPTPMMRPVGHADIVDQLAGRLPQCRLLTIAGPGGIGKTTLALVLADRLIDTYEHGVWLIDLAPLSDPHLVASAAAAALGITMSSEEPVPELIAYIRDKRMLLVLDNCEHVIASAEALAFALLRGAPHVQIIATSREPLRADGEHLYRVPPLASPPAAPCVNATEALAFPAVQLFVEHAARALGEFELSDADAPLVAGICRKLDGIPLAIQLAAGRVGALGVQGVAARMGDPLSLLTVGYRTAPPRHQSMNATLEWGYRLLSDIEQSILCRLSVFTASFTLGAAAMAAADMGPSGSEIIDHLLELVAKSLIITDIQDADPRLRLPGTTRAYARAKLAESVEGDTFYRRQAA
jgi:predicted ATPase/DNA-binding winged helix-turn-helix (wHTH) protein